MAPSDWIKLLYPNPPANSSLTIWNRQTKDSEHVPPTPGPALDNLIQDLVSRDLDVYFGVALRASGLQPHQRGKISDCVALPGLWLDIDINTGTKAHAAGNLPTSELQAIEILAALPDPTILISSGHGLHAYWLFEELLEVGYADIPKLTAASNAFQKIAIAHGAKLGYHVDNTANLDRVLRVPGTINRKEGLNVPVIPLDTGGPRYKDLESLLSLAGASFANPTQALAKPTDALEPSSTDRREDAAKAQDPDYVKECLKNLKNPETQKIADLVLAGKPFAQLGERDTVLNKIAGSVAYIAPDRDPEELAQAIFGPSLETFEQDDKGKYTQEDRVKWAAEKISRSQHSAREERARNEREDQKLHDALIKSARSAQRRDRRLGPSPSGPYSDLEIQAFAAQQKTTPQQFKQRWIIQKQDCFYVYVNGDYQRPIHSNEFESSIRRDLRPAVTNGFVKLDTLGANGPREKTMKEIIRDFSSVARNLVASLSAPHSSYDDQTQTFTEAVCPIRPLVPLYNPTIEQWLIVLGGKRAQQLLDWIATVTKLDHQSAALYLQGASGTGKTLLAHGLAKLWTLGGPTELDRVSENWTADIANCPLIFADEHLPKGQKTSSMLRAMIGSSSRTLTRKYAPNADLIGATRMILAANNPDMLTFDDTLSQADLEAIAGRFLHVEPDPNARAFLENTNTQGWVDDNLIAKHALWMADNRQVKAGRRFLVEGSARDVSKQLATRGTVAGRVAEWLVRYACYAKPNKKHLDMVRVGNGRYLCNTNAIATMWDDHTKSNVKPSTPQIGAALRNLATGTARVGSHRYYEIDVEAIEAWSDANLVGDPETILAKINQPIEEEPT